MSAQESDASRKKCINKARPGAATLCGVLLVLSNCGASAKDLELTNDQALLAKITVEDNDRSVCLTAVGRLSDQVLQAKIAVVCILGFALLHFGGFLNILGEQFQPN